jgi:hypothetical protein
MLTHRADEPSQIFDPKPKAERKLENGTKGRFLSTVGIIRLRMVHGPSAAYVIEIPGLRTALRPARDPAPSCQSSLTPGQLEQTPTPANLPVYRFARLEHFPTKWTPVGRRKCGKIKDL